jgi:dihydrodipicolinate synthase/N-acetylneuraminate lyase
VVELARSSPEIGCVKLEAGAERIAEWAAAAGGELAIFGGNAGLYLLDTLEHGAVGIAPGADVTDELAATYALWRAGDAEGARRRFAPVLPLLVFESQGIEHYNACAKHLLVHRGVLAGSHMRAPTTGLTPIGRALAERYFHDIPAYR